MKPPRLDMFDVATQPQRFSDGVYLAIKPLESLGAFGDVLFKYLDYHSLRTFHAQIYIKIGNKMDRFVM